VQLVLDADALIKLNRAGILQIVLSHFDCTVPAAVYDEVVTKGSELRYPDASAIGEVVDGLAEIPPAHESKSVTGKGEEDVLAILATKPGAYAVSDDRRFLRQLQASGVLYETPTDILVALYELGVVIQTDALIYLERLRDLIRPESYSEARRDIQNPVETP